MKEFMKNTAGPILFSLAFVGTLFFMASEEGKKSLKRQENPRIVVIDSCEYILTTASFGADKYVHKANCKNHH